MPDLQGFTRVTTPYILSLGDEVAAGAPLHERVVVVEVVRERDLATA